MGFPSRTRALIVVVSRRLVQAVLVALFVSTLSFFLMRVLPGDLAYRIAAARYGYDLVSSAAAEAVRTELGLDRPMLTALADWWAGLATLDLGTSIVTGAPVLDEIRHQLGQTIWLAAAAMGLSIAVGPIVGALAGWRPGGVLDRVTEIFALVARALPAFLVGLVLILVFSVRFGSLPAAGDSEPTSVVLPALTLAIGLAAGSCRVARDAMRSVSQSAYFAFARTKGLSARDTLLRHGLRNAAVPVIAYLGVQLVFLLEGVVVVETLFAWPGIGHALVHAIFGRDVPMIQGTTLVMALLFVSLNTLVDLATQAADPRQRRSN